MEFSWHRSTCYVEIFLGHYSFWVIIVDDERFNTTAVLILSWRDDLKNSHVDIAPL
jgi:hypothetical protein